MSASEKIRELHRSIHHDYREAAITSEYAYIDALPELLAVVEAAENFDARFEERFINGMAKPLNDALDALEKEADMTGVLVYTLIVIGIYLVAIFPMAVFVGKMLAFNEDTRYEDGDDFDPGFYG